MKTWGVLIDNKPHLFCSLDPKCLEQCLELCSVCTWCLSKWSHDDCVCVCVCVCVHTFDQPLLSVGYVWWWGPVVVWLFVTPGTIAHQASLSTDSPGKNTRVGCHFLLQGILLTQGSNPCLLHSRQILYCWATREARGLCLSTDKVSALLESVMKSSDKH